MRALIAVALLLSAAPPTPSAPPSCSIPRAPASRRLEGEIRAPGLDSAVEVRRDRWGVPHIYAKTVHDLFFAQGFVAAQDRLWQIDMWRRIGEGRVSEVLGAGFLERDRFARLLKYRGDMDAEWTSYAPDTKPIATAFVEGLERVRGAGEGQPADRVHPARLSPFAVRPGHAAAADGRALDDRATRSPRSSAPRSSPRWASSGPSSFSRSSPRARSIPRPGVDLASISPASLGAIMDAYRGLNYSRLDGSNNWVVSGSLTATGKPLLANDPHRSITNPSLRYLTHLVGPGWNVIGAGEPGVPGVAAGHNERVGFGFTIVGMDQQDVYVERLGRCPNGSDRRCYMGPTGWRPVRTIVDTIPVKGAAPKVVKLEFTEHGPIVSEDSTGRGYVIRFVGSEPGTAGYLAQLSVNRAQRLGELQGRDRALEAAHREPDLRRRGREHRLGRGGADADPLLERHAAGARATARYEWQGFLPFSELPMSFNPAGGVHRDGQSQHPAAGIHQAARLRVG